MMNKGQQFLLFLLVFAGTVGILKVDAAYSDMMDQEGILGLTVRRVDEENIRISALGMSEKVNMEEVITETEESWTQVQETVVSALDSFSASARHLLGLSDLPKQQDDPLRSVVFPVETL